MFKVQFNKEVRIFQNVEKIGSFKQLQEVVRGKFHKCPETFTFTFIDDEGDEITVQTDADLECFISFVGQNTKTKNLLKLTLHPTQQNLVQQVQVKISSPWDIQSQYLMYLPETSELSEMFQKLQQTESLQFQELYQTIQKQQNQYQIQYDQEQLFRILRSNLKRIEEKIIENTLDQTYNQIIKEEVSEYLDRNASAIAQIQILTQKDLSEDQNERQMSDIEDLDDWQLEKMVQKTLLKQMPTFIEELTRKTIKNVKNILSLNLIKTQHNQTNKILQKQKNSLRRKMNLSPNMYYCK